MWFITISVFMYGRGISCYPGRIFLLMTNTIDLHTHSTASDGIYEPRDLLQRAHAIGLRVLALTDHDSTDGIEQAREAAHELGIDFIPGIELNTDTEHGEIHVLGYFPEYQRPTFQATLKILRDARIHRGQRMVELLNEQGTHISWERVREIAQGSVGRPHIARALMEAGYVKTIGEAFDKYIGSDCPAYVPRYRLSPLDAVRLIRSANGLPTIAHPIGLPGLEQLRAWLPELTEAGMVGLETYYGPYTSEQEQELQALADQYGLIATGGTDFHGPGIHPTPLGGRFVPQKAVDQLKAEAAKRHGITPPPFELPAPVQEK
jgi:3',5'-nucleoside bisphosphate phosphatase